MDYLFTIIRITAGVVFLALFVPYCFFLLTLSRALSKCSGTSRTIEPGAVWLMLLPLFNLIWQFVVVAGLAKSLDREFQSRGVTGLEPAPGRSLGIAMCVCAVSGFVPIVNFITIPACMILFLIYWSKIAGFSKVLDRVSARDETLNMPQGLPEVMPTVHPGAAQEQSFPPPPTSTDRPPIPAPSRRLSMPGWRPLQVYLSRVVSSARGLDMRTKLIVLTSVLVVVVGVSVYWVTGAKVRACDNLAASPLDQQRPWGVKGVNIHKIDSGRAVAACQVAVQSKPIPRLFAELGRAFQAAGDPAQAAVNYRIAAERGYAFAETDLGLLFQSGSGVPQSYTEAAHWYRLGAAHGNAVAQNRLGILYEKGLGFQQSFSDAANWYRRSADQGFGDAENNIGLLYEKGNGVSQSFEEAAKWYRRAADHGNAWGEHNLGLFYLRGHGVPQSNSDAAKWMRRSADHGNAEAQFVLGVLYEQGTGVQTSSTEAVNYYKLAAAHGNKKAVARLQQMQQEAIGGVILNVIGAVLEGLINDSGQESNQGTGYTQKQCYSDNDWACHDTQEHADDENKHIDERDHPPPPEE